MTLAQAPREFLKVIKNKFQGRKCAPRWSVLHLGQESRLSSQGSVTIYGFEWNKTNLVVIAEFWIALNFEARTGTWRTSCKHRTADFIAGTFWSPGPAQMKRAHHLQRKRELKNSGIWNQESYQLLESMFNSFIIQRGKKIVLCHSAGLFETLCIQKFQRATTHVLDL